MAERNNAPTDASDSDRIDGACLHLCDAGAILEMLTLAMLNAPASEAPELPDAADGTLQNLLYAVQRSVEAAHSRLLAPLASRSTSAKPSEVADG